VGDPTTAYATARWVDASWLRTATNWATERLAEHGRVVVSEPEQTRVRPWSTMLRFQTDNGFFWFKANAIGTAHEIPLVEALA
jgi:hypothetical protein